MESVDDKDRIPENIDVFEAPPFSEQDQYECQEESKITPIPMQNWNESHFDAIAKANGYENWLSFV